MLVFERNRLYISFCIASFSNFALIIKAFSLTGKFKCQLVDEINRKYLFLVTTVNFIVKSFVNL